MERHRSLHWRALLSDRVGQSRWLLVAVVMTTLATFAALSFTTTCLAYQYDSSSHVVSASSVGETGRAAQGAALQASYASLTASFADESTSFAAEGGAAATDNVAVIGRQWDTAVAQDWPGHEVLNLPNGEWSIEANDKWVASVAERGMDVYTASPLTYENLWDQEAMRETVYARELRMFQSDEFGYTWDGDYLRAP